MRRFECIRRKILEIVSKTDIPEDKTHPENTLKWLLRIYPEADTNLRIAALGHDVERAFSDRKVRRGDFGTFDEFKLAHARNSARIMRELLAECGFPDEEVEDICKLVEEHEFGGTQRSDYLKIADTLSFFDNNLVHYFKRHDEEEVKRRIIWGLKRLPADMKKYLSEIEYRDEKLARIFLECLRADKNS